MCMRRLKYQLRETIKLRYVDFQARTSTHQTLSATQRELEIYSMSFGKNTIFSLFDTITCQNVKINSNVVKFLTVLQWLKNFRDYKNLTPSTTHRHL